jgi:hypothetical protein
MPKRLFGTKDFAREANSSRYPVKADFGIPPQAGINNHCASGSFPNVTEYRFPPGRE